VDLESDLECFLTDRHRGSGLAGSPLFFPPPVRRRIPRSACTVGIECGPIAIRGPYDAAILPRTCRVIRRYFSPPPNNIFLCLRASALPVYLLALGIFAYRDRAFFLTFESFTKPARWLCFCCWRTFRGDQPVGKPRPGLRPATDKSPSQTSP